ncbi:SMP-30/gluconolactonase/LRE family protein [Amycolatopsis anabasis]|uniref:SMP-30/gluconolactonase/LRE family protein n=1 Tax=Amycolatopsis anabasis TaxID=1840409 RepID=UPI00131EAFCE|nr:hypothetical protein [Amycolatopsis anabasis]
MRIFVVLATILGLTTIPAHTAAAAGATGSCPGNKPAVTTFHTATDWYENLEFDGRGRVWLANLTGNRLEAYGPAGDLRATVPLPAPGAIRRGPGGQLYANFGNNPASHAAPSGVVRFDPDRPAPEPYVTGDVLGSANGAEFDAAGNLYVSDPFAGLVKFRPGGHVDPDWRVPLYGANGVTTLGGQVFTTLLLDPRSPIVRVPRARPGEHERLAELSPSGEGELLDDLAVGPDHRLYATTYGSGELYRVDLRGRSCLLLSGLDRPTSIRFARGFGRPGDAYLTQASGSVLRLRFD